MTIRDQGPSYSVGFGVTSKNYLDYNPDETQGPNPEGGVLAKALHQHPLMRFFASSSAAMVGMAVGGALLRKGGIHLGVKLQDLDRPWVTSSIHEFRKVRRQLDAWQGLSRTEIHPDKLFVRGADGKIHGDQVHGELHGFMRTREEALYEKRTGSDAPAVWAMRDEIQKRLVRSGRRLPYELPAAYMVQRGVTDTLFGTGEEKKTNWSNPVDVITDFVTQSVRNTAFMVAPFEVAGGTGSQAWRRLMTAGDDMVNLPPHQQGLETVGVSIRAVLAQVGVDAAELMNKTAKVSSQVTGSFATGIREAQESSVSRVQYLYEMRHGSGAWAAASAGKKAKAVFNKNLYDIGPGPFTGIGTGVKAGRKAFTEIGNEYKAYEKLMTMGPKTFARRASEAEQQAANSYLARGAHPIEELTGRLRGLTKGGLADDSFVESEFFQGQRQNEYQKLLQAQLIKGGVAEGTAAKFTDLVTMAQPGRKRTAEQMIRGSRFGEVPFMAENSEEFFKEIVDRAKMLGGSETKALHQALPTAIGRADKIFSNPAFENAVKTKIMGQWKHFEDKLLPDYAENIIGRVKLPYEDFVGKMSGGNRSFLARKTAQASGLRMVDDTGAAVSDAVAHSHLRKIGIDPTNTAQQRAFLMDHKQMAMPWSREGRNIFGFKPLTIQDGLERGMFGGTKFGEKDIQDLSRRIANNDPLGGSIASLRMSGTFESASGRVIDFTRYKRAFQRTADVAATEFHVPLVKFNPLTLFGHSARAESRDRSLLQYVPSKTNQAFLHGTKSTDDFYMWMRTKRRRGKVFAIGTDAEGIVSTPLAGLYHPESSTAGMMARHARLATGDPGRGPSVASKAPRMLSKVLGPERAGKVRARFAKSDYEPDSIWGYARRFLDRKTDINNPVVMARLLKQGHLNGRQLGDFDEAELATAFHHFTTGPLRKQGFAKRVMNGFSNDDKFKDLTHYDFTKLNPKTFAATNQKLADLKNPAQIEEAARLMHQAEQAGLDALPKSMQGALKRAQDQLLGKHLRSADSPNYWDKMLPMQGRSPTINTRLDALQQDMYRYLTTKSGITKANQFDQVIPELFSKLDVMRKAGQISRAEYTEARTAVLSMQIDQMAYGTFARELVPKKHIMETIHALSMNQNAGKVLGDIAEGNFNNPGGRLDSLFPHLRKRFGTAPYRYDGTEYNPFGQRSDTTFVPTFGSVFERNPMGAIASTLGFNTWANPKAFSGASVPVSHLFERINRTFGVVGASVDPAQFKGPLDMYARGIIGKRALPIVAGSTALLTADRTIGGLVNEKDKYGDRVYSPYFLSKAATGVAYGQSALAGIVPGGMSYAEKRQEIFEGEVPIRSGRFWPIGSTPWKGGRIQYYRPSWYRRMKAGHLYTDQTYGSPLERLAFGYDFSPLRPLDPYRFERKHLNDRPYPVTGEYFSGPWGPLTSALNMTVGKVLKPQINMHEDEVATGLAQYSRSGEFGAVWAPGIGAAGADSAGAMLPISAGGGGGTFGGSRAIQANTNASYEGAGALTFGTGSSLSRRQLSHTNQGYMLAAAAPSRGGGFAPRIIPGQPPGQPSDLKHQAGQLGYEMQELFGIYGFAFGTARSMLGFGDFDMNSKTPTLASARQAYGSTRGFWDLNLGGLGDAPLPVEGALSNLEFSEVARRFVPKERSGSETLNPIPNDMGILYPWLPGDYSGYTTNFHRGDPFTSIQEGEIRLPGKGYERFNDLHSDFTGNYGLVDQHKILGSVAPWSTEYKELDRMVSTAFLSPQWAEQVQATREQVNSMATKHEFTPYKYKYETPLDMLDSPLKSMLNRVGEEIAHSDTFFNTKFLPRKTAVEDWERHNVYGSTFAEWQHPVKDFVMPAINNSTQENPVSAGLYLGTMGAFFGATTRARSIGSVIGGAIGFTAGTVGNIYERLSGKRYIPGERKRELALEENIDILTYIKNIRLANQAAEAGNLSAASQFREQAQQTMYGADVYSPDPDKLAMAIPKRKREHFRAMLDAPTQERNQILSTAGRLERRILESAWGMPVEQRPDLDEYFTSRELPGPHWEGWLPGTSMDHIKIKMGQHQGIELSEMGYYPQQITEANLFNPAYPTNLQGHQMSQRNVQAQLQELMRSQGISGQVIPVYTPYSGTRMNIEAGIR